MAASVIADRTPPSLMSFAVDLNQGLLNLTFSEPVNTTSLNFTSIMLSGGGAAVTLSVGTVIQSTGTVVIVMLSRGDLNNIKLAQQNFFFCTNSFPCGLSLTQYAVTDIAGNNITPVSSVFPTSVIPDTTPPRLESFDAISNSSISGLFTLVLHFSEPVRFTGSTPTVMSLSSSINGTFYVLQYSTIVMVSGLAADIVVVLDGRDVSNLLLMPDLLQIPSMTYLNVSTGAYRSLTLLSVTADLLSASSIQGDFAPPALTSFVLDYNIGQVILLFSKPVNISTSIPSKLVLEQALTSGAAFVQLPSDAIVTVGTNAKTVIVSAPRTLFDTMLLLGIGTSVNTTYIVMSHSFIRDLITLENLNTTLNAIAVISDMTPAVLQGFSFQINPAIIVFTFNKAVNGSTFDPTFITLQSGPTRASIQYTLTGGTASKSNVNLIQFNLTLADQLNIQLLSGLAVSQNTTYLSMSTFAATGINKLYIQAISPNAALEASSYVNASAPHLTKFNLDLNAGTITFGFDTSIDVLTFNISDVVLRNVTSSNLRFTGGVYSTKVSTSQLVVTLTSGDYDFILAKNLCGSNQTCFITYTSKVASDVFGNPVSANTIGVTTLIPDTTSPILVEFVLFNLTSQAQGVLRFSKPVDISSFNISGLVFQSLFDAPVATYIPSATLYVVAQSSRLVVFGLSSYDTASIKSNSNLCSIRGNCYVSVTPSLIRDTSGNLLSNISNAYPGQIVTTLVADTLPANIIAFTLDMNANQLLLTFDKPVRPATLVATAITIQASSNQTTNASLFYHFTGGSTSSPIQTIIAVNISYTDANTLKMLPFAKGVNSTFLSVTSNIIQDTSFYPNPTTAIPATKALQASGYTPDTTGPQVVSFVLDLSEDYIEITFNQPILLSTLVYSGITLSALSLNVTLSGGSLVPPGNVEKSVLVTFQLTDQDAALLKSNLSTTIVYFSIQNGTISDVFGNKNFAQFLFKATTVIPDTTRANLLAFSLDLNVGFLNLTFDDLIDPTMFYPPAITIQSAKAVRPIRGPLYTLTDSTVLQTYNFMVNILLSQQDRIGLFQVSGLATSKNNTYLTMQADAFNDYLSVDVIAVTDGMALQVTTLVLDTQGITLELATLDKNRGNLHLTFSDIVNASTIVFSGIVLQSGPTISVPYRILRSGNSVVTRSLDALTLTIQLDTSDLNTLKSYSTLGTSIYNTYVNISQNAVLDLAKNGLTASVVRISLLINDTTSPSLVAFIFDRNVGVLTLQFSETISINPFNATQITIQSSQLPANVNVTLSGGSATLVYLTSLNLVLLPSDLFTLFLIPGIGTTNSNTYISVTNLTITDASGIALAPIIPVNALQATAILGDTTKPTIAGFTLDMDKGLLILNVSKPVDSMTLNITKLILQNSAQSPATVYGLTLYASVPLSSSLLSIPLSTFDLNNIKQMTTIATGTANTYLVVRDSAFADTNGNYVSNVTLQAARCVADTTPPVLTSFSLNLASSVLTLTFSEIVNVSTLQVNAITLQNSNNFVNYTLQTSLQPTTSAAVLSISLSITDGDAIKLAPGLATSINNTYIYMPNASVIDFSKNAFIEQTLQAALVIPDTIPPVIASYSVDLDKGTVTLQFSEPVVPQTLKVAALTLYRTPSNPGIALDSSVTATAFNSSLIVTNLSSANLNSIKFALNGTNTTYLTVPAGAVIDIAGNSIAAISLPGLPSFTIYPD